jgi:hypothetical protein
MIAGKLARQPEYLESMEREEPTSQIQLPIRKGIEGLHVYRRSSLLQQGSIG